MADGSSGWKWTVWGLHSATLIHGPEPGSSRAWGSSARAALRHLAMPLMRTIADADAGGWALVKRIRPSFPWPRFCSRLCQQAHREAPTIYQRMLAASLTPAQRGRMAWLMADQRRRSGRAARNVGPRR